MQRTVTTTRRLQPIKRNMLPLIAAPMSAPATFAGRVDATSDRIRPTARTVCQAFGPYASSRFVEPLQDKDEGARGHRAVLASTIAVGVIVVLILIAERFAAVA